MSNKFADKVKAALGKVIQRHPSEEAGSDTAVPSEGPLGTVETVEPTVGSVVEQEEES